MNLFGERFVEAINTFATAVHNNAVSKGFWEEEATPTKLALIHSEITEALEAVRNHDPQSKAIPEFSSLEEELADTIIRILDLSGGMNLRIGEAIMAKHQFNLTRPRKHGGKLF